MTLIRLNSDNYDNVLMTPEAYEYVALSMSSGDHGTHTAVPVVIPEEYAGEYLNKVEVMEVEGYEDDYDCDFGPGMYPCKGR